MKEILELDFFREFETYDILVKPNSSKEEILVQDDKIVVRIQAPAHDNLANKGLIKFFKKKLNLNVEIVKGKKNRNKTIRIV